MDSLEAIGRPMTPDRTALQEDVADRIAKVQAMMDKIGVKAAIFTGQGAPDGFGAVRYLSNARLWSGTALLVLGVSEPSPWLAISSPYQAVWTRDEAAIPPERIESPDDPIAWLRSRIVDIAGATGKIGLIDCGARLPWDERQAIHRELSHYEIVNLTGPFEAIRARKTAFEIAAFREHGALLDAAMDRFESGFSEGTSYAELCAETEAFIRSTGAFWGRCKLSLDGSPYTVPAPIGRCVRADDVVNFELVYESRWGYWQEMTSVFALTPLSHEQSERLDAYLLASEHAAEILRPGTCFGDIARITDETFTREGWRVRGKHTPDCHGIGLDGVEGLSSALDPDRVLEAGMVLSLHPGSILEGRLGFLISDNFLVTEEGGVRLSPHTTERCRRILPHDASR